MIRLFSGFPSGRPGIALILLRVSVAATFLITASVPCGLSDILFRCVTTGAVALLLCAGFLTPIVAAACCLLELSDLYALSTIDARFLALSALNAAALMLLGPGAYSLDSRMFGLRVVIFPPPER
ncbi:MAG: hypothetical protein WDO73_12060 [Ignavibacteriota bacterium]